MSATWYWHAQFTVINTANDRQRCLNYVSSCFRTVLRVSPENDTLVLDTVHITHSRNADSTNTYCIGVCATTFKGPVSWCIRDGAWGDGFKKPTFLLP